MVKHMKEVAIARIRALRSIHPPNSLLTIGQTKDIKKRFSNYDQHDQVYQNFQDGRYVEFDEYILFSAWTRNDIMQYEYILQKELNFVDGRFYDEFRGITNNQQIAKPALTKNNDIVIPYYVYVKLTSEPFIWKDHMDNSHKTTVDDQTQEPPSKKQKLIYAINELPSTSTAQAQVHLKSIQSNLNQDSPSTSCHSVGIETSTKNATSSPILLSSSSDDSILTTPSNAEPKKNLQDIVSNFFKPRKNTECIDLCTQSDESQLDKIKEQDEENVEKCLSLKPTIPAYSSYQ